MSLSDKIWTYDGEEDDGSPAFRRIISSFALDNETIFVKDVREAVKELKFKLCNDVHYKESKCRNCRIIDEIFGEKLV